MHDVSQQVNLQVSMFTWLFNAVSSSLWVLQHFYVHNTERGNSLIRNNNACNCCVKQNM